MIIQKSFVQKISAYVIVGVLIITSVTSYLLLTDNTNAAISIIFPVIGTSRYSNDFDAPRGNGPHHAIDIIANKGQKIVSASDGVISYVGYPQPSWGYSVFIEGNDGYTYNYIHLNNDTPGSDDGKGGAMNAYAPDMKQGNVVKKGQHIGYVGDSGNAEGTVSHLHFEIYNSNDVAVNPYLSLKQARHISAPVGYPQLAGELLPYGIGALMGANISNGNFDADPARELVTGAGHRGGPHVKIFDNNNTPIKGFFAYNTAFRGGVDIAVGDMDGDSVDDIITVPGRGGGPQVKMFKKDGTGIGSFMAYDSKDRTGLRVAVGDVDDDGINEVITTFLAGGPPLVRVFEKDGTLISELRVYSTKFRGGLDVASGDVNGDGIDEIVTGAGPTADAHVKVLRKDGTIVSQFHAYNPGYTGGVRVDVGNAVTGTVSEEIATVPMSRGGPQTRLYNYQGGRLKDTFFLERWWIGTYDITIGPNYNRAAVGIERRFSVRSAAF